MTEALVVKLRASAAPGWLRCAQRADWSARNRGESGEDAVERKLAGRGYPVATLYGSMVHELVTGAPAEMPPLIEYDQHTRSERELRRQVAETARLANGWILAQGFWRVRREVELKATITWGQDRLLAEGHADLEVTRDAIAPRVSYIDLKTGLLHPQGAWAQMAVYAYLGRAEGVDLDEVVMLHVPRAQTVERLDVFRRPAAALAAQAPAIFDHVMAQADLAVPLASPGLHCGNCENTDCVYHEERGDD